MPSQELNEMPVGAHAIRAGDDAFFAATATVRQVIVGRSEEIPERGRIVVGAGGTEIGVFRIDGELYALENYCAHYGGPVCQGRVLNRVLEVLDEEQKSLGMKFSDEEVHIVCPWHGYEYDIRSGESAIKPNIRLRTFAVREVNGDIVVDF